MSAEPTAAADTERPGFPVAVVGVALATGVGMIPVFAGVNLSRMPSAATVSAGWVALGLAAALLVDRPDLRRVGWVFAACAVVPAVVGLVAVIRDRDQRWTEFARLWDGFGGLLVGVSLVAMACAVDWARDRMSRRRLVWLVCWGVALLGAVLVGGLLADEGRASVVTMIALWAFAAAATRILLARDLRPVVEPLVDTALVVAAIIVSAALGLGTLAGGRWSGLPSPTASAVFVAVAAIALSWPLGIWLRRNYIERRYGRGTLTPADVALITAGLHREADPRELLAQAAPSSLQPAGTVRSMSCSARTSLMPPTASSTMRSSSAVTGSAPSRSDPSIRRARSRGRARASRVCCQRFRSWRARSSWRSRPSTRARTSRANVISSGPGSSATCTMVSDRCWLV